MAVPIANESISAPFISPAVARFFWGFGPSFLVSLLWPLSLVIWLPQYASLWIQNNPTFTLIHLTFISGAVGLFASIVSLEPFRPLPMFVRFLFFGVLAVFVLVVTGFVYEDLVYRDVSAYQQKPEATKAQEDLRQYWKDHEQELSQLWKQKKPGSPEYARKLADFKEKTKPPGSFTEVRKRITPVAYVTLLMNWGFGVFVATYFWYIASLGVLFFFKRVNKDWLTDPRLVVALAMVATWFPARLYGDWWQHCFLPPSTAEAANPVFNATLIIAFLVLLLLIYYQVIGVLNFAPKAFTFFVFGLIAVVVVLSALNLTTPIFEFIEEGSHHGIFGFVAVGCVLLSIALVVAINVFPQPGPFQEGEPAGPPP